MFTKEKLEKWIRALLDIQIMFKFEEDVEEDIDSIIEIRETFQGLLDTITSDGSI